MEGITNQFKTFVLLALLTALMLWAGSLFGRTGFYFAIVFVILLNFGSYFYSHKIVLAMYRAKEVKESDYPDLFKIVREVSGLADIPMPKVYMIPTDSSNAFATGRNPKHAVVAVTQGIMTLLSKNELKGVIAHEISHIKNRDILIQTVAATIAGVISYMGVMARWGAIFGGFGGRDKDNNLAELLVIGILTPIIALIIRLAISRSREYLADSTGARTIHDPYSLAGALEKLDRSIKQNPLRFGNKTTSSLFIANPFRDNGIFALFSTHPPLKERVRRLRAMSP